MVIRDEVVKSTERLEHKINEIKNNISQEISRNYRVALK
jgi:hypothetical protein